MPQDEAMITAFAGLDRHDLAGRITLLRARLQGRIVFTTSFGLEDQVITQAIADSGVDIALATLDTGRLFPQTHALWAQTEARYGLRIAAFHPEAAALADLVQENGINGFYHSVAARQSCCAIRKLRPLDQALAGASGWITGLRADQSEARRGAGLITRDAARGLVKASPLSDWSRAEVLARARALNIPLNPLHDEGFVSIGCAPCTRAPGPGEEERAGRWWWEQDGKKECGLHLAARGHETAAGASS